jgi:DNA methylase
MSEKRKVIAVLSKAELLEIGYGFSLPVVQRMNVDELRDVIASSKRATLPRVLPFFSRDALKDACTVLGLAVSGSKADLIARIAPAGDEPAMRAALPIDGGIEADGELKPSGAAAMDVAPARRQAQPAPPATTATTMWRTHRRWGLQPLPAQPRLAHMLLTRALRATGTCPSTTPSHFSPAPFRGGVLASSGTDSITARSLLRCPHRSSRSSVRRGSSLGRASSRSTSLAHPSRPRGARQACRRTRLIWTNDNLVALQTLLDERDPETRGYRYRGKIDLVYIDPPFMVQSDFRADNAIDIDLDEDEGVQVKKEPSLVEILAYKDTWRQGLDSFLSMLRARLVLLKEMLASTGNVYVHLDWHAMHYVKVLMDEVFGYENFVNEITWRRTNARVAPGMWPRVHDTILLYRNGPGSFMEPEISVADPSKLPHTLITGKDGNKYQTFELTAPNLRYVRRARSGMVFSLPEWDDAGRTHPRLWMSGTAKDWSIGRQTAVGPGGAPRTHSDQRTGA